MADDGTRADRGRQGEGEKVDQCGGNVAADLSTSCATSPRLAGLRSSRLAS